MSIDLVAWVDERIENCERILKTKFKAADRQGWQEDKDYFQMIRFKLAANGGTDLDADTWEYLYHDCSKILVKAIARTGELERQVAAAESKVDALMREKEEAETLLATESIRLRDEFWQQKKSMQEHADGLLERCAKVAEQYINPEDGEYSRLDTQLVADAIAAAIRALVREQP